jgi:hypothetical protein
LSQALSPFCSADFGVRVSIFAQANPPILPSLCHWDDRHMPPCSTFFLLTDWPGMVILPISALK